MSDQGRRGSLADWDSDDDDVAEAMGHAISDALREHKRAGVSIAVWDWEQNCVRIIPPDEIIVPDDVDVTVTAAPQTNRIGS